MPGFLAHANPVAQFLDAEKKQIAQLDETFVTPAVELQKQLADHEKQEETCYILPVGDGKLI